MEKSKNGTRHLLLPLFSSFDGTEKGKQRSLFLIIFGLNMCFELTYYLPCLSGTVEVWGGDGAVRSLSAAPPRGTLRQPLQVTRLPLR